MQQQPAQRTSPKVMSARGNPSANQRVDSSSTSANSEFLSSFERLAFVSSEDEWRKLTSLRDAIAARHSLVREKVAQVNDLNLAIVRALQEVDTLEAQLSETITQISAQRNRSQDQLRALLLQWENNKLRDFAQRENQIQAECTAKLENAQQEISQLKGALNEAEAEAADRKIVIDEQLKHIRETQEHLMIRAAPSTPPPQPLRGNTSAAPRSPSQQNVKMIELEARVAELQASLKVKNSECASLRELCKTADSSFTSQQGGGAMPSPFAATVVQQRSSTPPMTMREASAGSAAPSFELPAALGFQVSSRRQQMRQQGVLVTEVTQGGKAWNAGLRPDDVLTEWNLLTVNSIDDLATACRIVRPGSNVPFACMRRMPDDTFTKHRFEMFVERIDGPFNSHRVPFQTL